MIRTILVNAVSLLILDVLMQGISFDSTYALLVTAAVLGVLNRFLKPVLKVITLPLNIITLGLFSFVINGFILKTALSFSGSAVDTFPTIILASVILGFINSFVTELFGEDKKK